MARPAALAVLLLVAVAGCNAPANPTPTVTPAAVPEGPVGYPPGLSPDGVDRPERLAEAHADAVADRSYAWTLEERRYTDRTVGVERVSVRRAGPARYNGSVLREFRRREGAVDRRTLVYADGEHRYSRTVENGTASVRREPARRVGDEGVYEATAERLVVRYLAVGNATVTRTERDGETLFRLVGRTTGRVSASGYRVVALVTPAGLVRELRASYEPRRGPVRAVELRWRYGGLGRTTVSAPAWYPPG